MSTSQLSRRDGSRSLAQSWSISRLIDTVFIRVRLQFYRLQPLFANQSKKSLFGQSIRAASFIERVRGCMPICENGDNFVWACNSAARFHLPSLSLVVSGQIIGSSAKIVRQPRKITTLLGLLSIRPKILLGHASTCATRRTRQRPLAADNGGLASQSLLSRTTVATLYNSQSCRTAGG